MTSAEYSMFLSAALRTENLTHSLFDVLTAVALDTEARGYSTIPAIHLKLGCTFNNIQLHLFRNADLFVQVPDHHPRRFELSQAGVQLLARIKTAVNRRAAMMDHEERSERITTANP